MNLDTGVYLRADTIQTLALCCCLPYSLRAFPRPPHPSHQQAMVPLDAWAEIWVRSCCAAIPNYRPWASWPRSHCTCSHITMHLPDLRYFPPFPGSSFQLFSFQNHLLAGTLLSGSRSSLQNPRPDFPNLNGPCAEAQHVTSLLPGGSVSWLFINWSIEVVLFFFSSCIIKLCKQTIPLTASKEHVSASVFRSSILDSHTPTYPMILLPVNIHNLSYFFAYDNLQ